MIIKYRGEIIGNAVEDKREWEYERSKLDDYMYQINAFMVCRRFLCSKNEHTGVTLLPPLARKKYFYAQRSWD